MGLVLGIAAAICFAAASILFKIGQRNRPDDNGLFVSILVNTVMLGAVAIFLTWPAWSTSGFVGLVVGGVIGTVFGRASNLNAIRLIGPSRANAFLTANPVVTALAGWFVLDETLGPQEFLGGALVIGGLLWLIRSRSSPGGPDAGPPPTMGYVWAVLAPTFFGLAFVFRKWAIARYPGSVIGAFIGAAAALVVVAALDARSGQLRKRLRDSFIDVSWWYVVAGAFTSLALLSQFAAFTYIPAWVVGIVQGTQGLFTLLLGWLFLRQEERIDRTLVGTVVLVVAGVTLIGIEL